MLISWNITKACNLKCGHCYRDAGKALKNELTFEEGKKLLGDLKELGFRTVIFSGGEPLLREDLCALTAFAGELGLVCVLGSNGTLISAGIVRDLKAAGLKRAGISLDSIESSLHDKFRGVDGAWKQAISGMENCKAAGLEFQVHTTATKNNIAEVLKVSEYAQELGAKAHHIFFLVPAGRGKDIDAVVPDVSQYETLLEGILEKQKDLSIELKPVCAPQFVRMARQKKIPLRFEKGCLAGISYACILPDGEVHPCPYLPLKLGNVREKGGFINIWRNNKVLDELRGLRLKGKCGICEYKTNCSGCRAAAFYQSKGDYLAQDSNCAYEPKRKINT